MDESPRLAAMRTSSHRSLVESGSTRCWLDGASAAADGRHPCLLGLSQQAAKAKAPGSWATSRSWVDYLLPTLARDCLLSHSPLHMEEFFETVSSVSMVQHMLSPAGPGASSN